MSARGGEPTRFSVAKNYNDNHPIRTSTTSQLFNIEASKKLEYTHLFEIEGLIFKLFYAIKFGEDTYDLFKLYIDSIQDYNFEQYMSIITDQTYRSLCQLSFLYERFSLLLCFYLLLTNNFEKESIFMQKVIQIVYSNCKLFLDIIIKSLYSHLFKSSI